MVFISFLFILNNPLAKVKIVGGDNLPLPSYYEVEFAVSETLEISHLSFIVGDSGNFFS